MANIILGAKRIKTMRQRLGKASELVDADEYLPMYRNRQIREPELFEFSRKLSRRKNNPKGYFATIWSKRNVDKSIKWLRELVNRAKADLAEARERTKTAINPKDYNTAGLERLRQAKQQLLARRI